MEVVFWGVRNLKTVGCFQINRPQIKILCADQCIVSDTIENARKNPNFTNYIKSMTIVRYIFHFETII